MPDVRTVTACVIIIGNEILSGRTHDANLPYLAKALNGVGVRVMEARVVRDEEAPSSKRSTPAGRRTTTSSPPAASAPPTTTSPPPASPRPFRRADRRSARRRAAGPPLRRDRSQRRAPQDGPGAGGGVADRQPGQHRARLSHRQRLRAARACRASCRRWSTGWCHRCRAARRCCLAPSPPSPPRAPSPHRWPRCRTVSATSKSAAIRSSAPAASAPASSCARPTRVALDAAAGGGRRDAADLDIEPIAGRRSRVSWLRSGQRGLAQNALTAAAPPDRARRRAAASRRARAPDRGAPPPDSRGRDRRPAPRSPAPPGLRTRSGSIMDTQPTPTPCARAASHRACTAPTTDQVRVSGIVRRPRP